MPVVSGTNFSRFCSQDVREVINVTRQDVRVQVGESGLRRELLIFAKG